MHAVYALLLPGKDPEEILVEAESLIQAVGDENNWYAFIGLVLPDGEVVSLASPPPEESEFARLSRHWPGGDRLSSLPVSRRWTMESLDKMRGDRSWLDLVHWLAARDIADWWLPGQETLPGREELVRLLIEKVADEEEKSYRRQLAAQHLVTVLDENWPFVTELGGWYRQRVYCRPDVTPEEAAIVLVDIHT